MRLIAKITENTDHRFEAALNGEPDTGVHVRSESIGPDRIFDTYKEATEWANGEAKRLNASQFFIESD